MGYNVGQITGGGVKGNTYKTSISLIPDTFSPIMDDLILNSLTEWVIFNYEFEADHNYYLHFKISSAASLSETQTMKIYLRNFTTTENKEIKVAEKQQLETMNDIILTKNTSSNDPVWIDVELFFNSVAKFSCISFEVDLTSEDFTVNQTPAVVCLEASEISNLSFSGISSAQEDLGLYKIGIQSRPSTMFFVNNEPIRIGKSGIYEIRNGLLYINQVAIVNPDNIAIDMNTGHSWITEPDWIECKSGMHYSSKSFDSEIKPIYLYKSAVVKGGGYILDEDKDNFKSECIPNYYFIDYTY